MVPTGKGPAVASPYPQGWDQLEEFERYLNDFEDPDDFYGFDHIELAIDHGARATGHHLRWALERGGKLEELLVPHSADAPALDRSSRWWQIYRPPYGPELHSTTFVTERTIAFIEEAVGEEKPWLAYCPFPDPHHPMAGPGEWYDRHQPADMTLPSTIDDPMEGGLPHLKRVQGFRADQQRQWVSPFGAGDHELVKEAIAGTYGVIEMIDDGVGQILAAVDRAGQANNTIVIFTSDHGDMMGEHGLMLKGFMPYRGTHQVPFVIAPPGGSANRTPALACSTDLAPTILELCGLDGFDGIQGRSLRPVLDDPKATVRDHVLIEDDCPPALSGGRTPEKIRTVVTTNLASVDPARRGQAVEAMMGALLDADDLARGAPVGA